MKMISKLFTAMFMTALMMILSTNPTSATESGVDWTTSVVRVTGQGMAPANAVNEVHGRMLARRAAVADGYRQLAELINGVTVEAGTNVEDMMVANDEVKLKVNATIKGATVVDERDLPGGGYEVVMEVPLYGVSNSLAPAVIKRPEKKVEFPKPVKNVEPAKPTTTINITINSTTKIENNTNIEHNTKIENNTKIEKPQVQPKPQTQPQTQTQKPVTEKPKYTSKAIGGFTGLIVDCRGLGLKPAMSPVIVNAKGDKVYGHRNLDYDKIIEIGMVSYTSDINNVSRAGTNPLVVRAIKVQDHNSNPVISVADSNRILLENDKDQFLDKMNVVFIR